MKNREAIQKKEEIKMIKVTLGNNVKRKTEVMDKNTTLREALENAEIDYTTGIMNLDGSTLNPGDLDKTFADFGINDKCYLLNVVKADNAYRKESRRPQTMLAKQSYRAA
jgi:hypothetical protein